MTESVVKTTATASIISLAWVASGGVKGIENELDVRTDGGKDTRQQVGKRLD